MLGIISTVPTNIFRIFGNALAFLIKPNTITENRKQKLKWKERGTENLPAQPTTVAAYWPKPAQPTRGSTVFILLPGGEAAACPVRRRTTPAPPCLRAPRPPGRLHAYHAASSTLSHSPSSSSPPLAPLHLAPERTAVRRRAPPRPLPPPGPLELTKSSAASSSTPTPSHATPDAPQRRLCPRLQPRAPEIATADSTPPSRPRAR